MSYLPSFLSFSWGQLIILFILSYISYYLVFVRHRAIIKHRETFLTKRIIEKMPSLQKYYYPFFIFWSSFVSLLLQGRAERKLKEKYKKDISLIYDREVLFLSDGEILHLDWTYPRYTTENVPVVLFAHGICGSGYSYYLVKHAPELSRKGSICCVWTRRGMDANTPLRRGKMAVFGYRTDLHEIICHIMTKYPKNPIFMIGFSAGTSPIARYLGELGYMLSKQKGSLREALYKQYGITPENEAAKLKTFEKIQDKHIKGAVLVSCGYNMTLALERFPKFMQEKALGWFKDVFLYSHFIDKETGEPKTNTQFRLNDKKKIKT